jgi:thiol-disulfide isomerase/thioredoxin
MIDKYIRTGWTKGYYDEATIEKIKERGDILKPLLLESPAPDILMMDTTAGKILNKMGFDTAKTGYGINKIYAANVQKINSLYTTLYSIKAKYTIMVFWDVDCGHCQTEIPKLLETYKELRKKYDVKVFSVYTQHEFDKWRQYLIVRKYDFINVYDGVYINNLKQKYDIFSTPKIYLLDKNKIIKSKGFGQEQLPDIIKNLESSEKEKEKK